MTRSKIHLSGIQLMIQAAFAFSLMAFFVKLASRTLPSLEIVFFRSLIGTVLIAVVILKKRASLLGKERGLMVLRGLTGFAALSLHFYTIARLPLGTAVMLNYTGPIFAALFAVLFLKEKPSPLLIMMTALSFCGVYLLVGGSVGAWNLNVSLGLLSAVFVGAVYVLIRAIRRRESPLTVIFYFTAVSTAGSVFFLPFGFLWPNALEWLILLGVGIGSFYGQLWLTIALRRAPASLVSPFSYLTPIFSYIYGMLFFHDQLTPVALAGIALIMTAGCAISLIETRRQKK